MSGERLQDHWSSGFVCCLDSIMSVVALSIMQLRLAGLICFADLVKVKLL